MRCNCNGETRSAFEINDNDLKNSVQKFMYNFVGNMYFLKKIECLQWQVSVTDNATSGGLRDAWLLVVAGVTHGYQWWVT